MPLLSGCSPHNKILHGPMNPEWYLGWSCCEIISNLITILHRARFFLTTMRIFLDICFEHFIVKSIYQPNWKRQKKFSKISYTAIYWIANIGFVDQQKQSPLTLCSTTLHFNRPSTKSYSWKTNFRSPRYPRVPNRFPRYPNMVPWDQKNFWSEFSIE